ncbi:MAG: CGNR zinc finger domain-containing protein [Acidimicrobiia bacterium]|jgi:predicted RNA-binding Zn ribbon-like protein
MDFSHYTTKPVELAVALANTKGMTEDHLTEPEQLIEFLESYRDLWDGVSAAPKPGDLPAVQEIRSSIRDVILSEDPDTAAARVNEMLDANCATPRISTHNGTPHLHFEPLETSIVCWLGATTAMGLASVLVEHGVDRFGVCDSTTCDDVFVDTSRNKSRRHCSNTCSTREAVAAYRKRKAD